MHIYIVFNNFPFHSVHAERSPPLWMNVRYNPPVSALLWRPKYHQTGVSRVVCDLQTLHAVNRFTPLSTHTHTHECLARMYTTLKYIYRVQSTHTHTHTRVYFVGAQRRCGIFCFLFIFVVIYKKKK